MKRKYEFIEHTGDLGFKAYGTSLQALFAHAAEALFETVVPVESIKEREKRVVEVAADALDNLMVGWLSELLYLFDTEGVLLRRFEVKAIADDHLKALVWGELLDPARHEIKTGIKAVTYHKLYVRQTNDAWEAQVILDI
ncbi:MAG: archease [Desulfobacterales bacterium]|nr:archease [Desulfobacterales bacterium]